MNAYEKLSTYSTWSKIILQTRTKTYMFLNVNKHTSKNINAQITIYTQEQQVYASIKKHTLINVDKNSIKFLVVSYTWLKLFSLWDLTAQFFCKRRTKNWLLKTYLKISTKVYLSMIFRYFICIFPWIHDYIFWATNWEAPFILIFENFRTESTSDGFVL